MIAKNKKETEITLLDRKIINYKEHIKTYKLNEDDIIFSVLTIYKHDKILINKIGLPQGEHSTSFKYYAFTLELEKQISIKKVINKRVFL